MRGPDDAEIGRRIDLLDRHGVGSGARLLDVGTGAGGFVDAARRRGLRAVGCEVSLAALVGRVIAFPAFVGVLDAVRPDAGLDAICFWDVLEHLPHPLEVLRAAAERLGPQGHVAVSMPNHCSTTRAAQGWRWPYYDFALHGHLLHLSVRQVKVLLSRAGLAPVYWETRGSVDLRTVPVVMGWGRHRAVLWAADKLSGALARTAAPLGYGNTLIVVAQRQRARTR